jgi:hypothetical protein
MMAARWSERMAGWVTDEDDDMAALYYVCVCVCDDNTPRGAGPDT